MWPKHLNGGLRQNVFSMSLLILLQLFPWTSWWFVWNRRTDFYDEFYPLFYIYLGVEFEIIQTVFELIIFQLNWLLRIGLLCWFHVRTITTPSILKVWWSMNHLQIITLWQPDRVAHLKKVNQVVSIMLGSTYFTLPNPILQFIVISKKSVRNS